MPADQSAHPDEPAIPSLPSGSRLQVIESPYAGTDSSAITLELPPGGRRMLRRVVFCVVTVFVMSLVPIVGAWYFFVYRELMPGPGEGLAAPSVPTAGAESAPGWYPWLMTISLVFISAIFVFTAIIFLIEALHILKGTTRLTISSDGIEAERRLWNIRVRMGDKFIPAEEIAGIEVRPDEGRVPGGIRLTVVRQPVDLAEEVDLADREWLAARIRECR